MNLQEHFEVIAAKKAGTAEKPMAPIRILKDDVDVNAVGRFQTEQLAHKFGLQVAFPEGSIKMQALQGERTVCPVAIVDISTSMVTPENKAMVALVAQGMQDVHAATKTKTNIIGVHTTAINFNTDYDAFFKNTTTGGTILSRGLRYLMEQGAPDGINSTGLVYVLTDGENWADDNDTFYDVAEALYKQGAINRMVIHISTLRKTPAFEEMATQLSRNYDGIRVVRTDARFEHVHENAQEALEAFRD